MATTATTAKIVYSNGEKGTSKQSASVAILPSTTDTNVTAIANAIKGLFEAGVMTDCKHQKTTVVTSDVVLS